MPLIRRRNRFAQNHAALYVPAPGGGATTTWNPADKSANLALSGGDLVVTNNSATTFSAIRSVANASSGLKYFEVTATTVADLSQNGVGVGNSSASLATYNDANGIHWFGDGNVYRGGSAVTTLYAWAQGDVICVATDFGNNRIWFRKNASNWNNSGTANPATNTEGIDISAITGPFYAMAEAKTIGDVYTANFGGSTYAQTRPSGFGNF